MIVCFSKEHWHANAVLAGLNARCNGYETQINLLERELEIVRAEKTLIQDDLRRLLGLKPRVVAAPAGTAEEARPRNAFEHNEQIKIKSSPRDIVAGAQRKLDQANTQREQDEISALITNWEEVAKQA